MSRNRKVLAVIGAALLVFVAAGVVYAAALTPQQQDELNDLHQQLAAIRKQIVQKKVEFKLLTPEQGKTLEERIDRWTERAADCDGACPCRGNGRGMGRRGGYGLGMGRSANGG